MLKNLSNLDIHIFSNLDLLPAIQIPGRTMNGPSSSCSLCKLFYLCQIKKTGTVIKISVQVHFLLDKRGIDGPTTGMQYFRKMDIHQSKKTVF